MDPQYIEVENGREHNLQSVTLRIEKGCFTVVTGVSGSGKSSLVYNTLYKEAERLYFSSFPSWSRKYLGVVARPKADRISGLDAAIVVDQQGAVSSARSTVGTYSGVYDLLRLLFARFGTVPDALKASPELFNPSGTLSRSLFSFNAELGRCPVCRGLGVEEAIDPERTIADPAKSIRERGLRNTAPSGYIIYSQVTLEVLDRVCRAHGFSIDTPLRDLTPEQRDVLFYGSRKLRVPFGKHPLESRMKWTGITARPREEGYYPGFVTVMNDILKRDRNPGVLRFVRSLPCSRCHGSRLREEALAVTYRGRTIQEVASLSLDAAAEFLRTGGDAGERELTGELVAALSALSAAGLGHLTLARPATTLSGGEIQRIRIAALARNRLRGVLYIFDEPTVGLHRSEAREVVRLLLALRDRGNTVLAVDHDPDTIRLADQVIETGPAGGQEGGRIVFCGSVAEFFRRGPSLDSPTWRALTGPRTLPAERELGGEIVVAGATRHNLKGITVPFRRGAINVITGRSGAGKRSLLGEVAGQCEREGLGCLTIDRSPIGKTPRSNPATYTGIADRLRDLFASLAEAQAAGLSRGHFSFNSAGGRCEACEGAGVIEIGMKYLGSVEVECDRCHGRRFNPEVLRVRTRGRNIADVYDMSVAEAGRFFAEVAPIHRTLQIMERIGLGYLRLGQTTSSLSGGEAQRVRLAAHLAKSRERAVLLFEEPTAGLHPQDTGRLIAELDRLARQGHTVVAVEHDPFFIASADHLVELGPGAGERGGRVLYAGPPRGLLAVPDAPTAQVLREFLAGAGREEPPPREVDHPAARVDDVRLTGVTTHNLKNIDVSLRPGTFTVITGVSGSGKTSLVFDTLFPESLRAFLAGTSPYVQSMLRGGRDCRVDSADRLMPPVAVSPRFTSLSPRSTAGTVSGIYELLRMLYARAGLLPDGTACPFSAGDFSFNSGTGACPGCQGTGVVLRADRDLLISHPERSFLAGALDGTRPGRFYGEPDGQYVHTLRAVGQELGIDFGQPVAALAPREFAAAWDGTGERIYSVEWHYARGRVSGTHRFSGQWIGFDALLVDEFHRAIGHRNEAELRGLMREEPCPDCRGRRLKDELLRVGFAGRSIAELGAMEAADLADFLKGPPGLSAGQRRVLEALAPELTALLERMIRLGLGHVAPFRSTASLSLGERERLKLIRIGSQSLQNVLYLLDEPSRGLHPADCLDLTRALREIVDRGNTVVAVEHEPVLIGQADRVIELGPAAGEDGGEIIFSGTVEELRGSGTPTGAALAGGGELRESRATRRVAFRAAVARNLAEIDVELPLGETTVITGVSGSGKTTLLKEVIAASLECGRPVRCRELRNLPGPACVCWHENRVASPAGGASTIATSAGLLDRIRKEFAATAAARDRGLKAAFFSPAGEGGCPVCRGSGLVTVAMDFLSDSSSACRECDGLGFTREALAITLDGRSIADVLAMSVDEALRFFAAKGPLRQTLAQVAQCGLGYLTLGQPLATFSTGEIQRLDLAVTLDSFAREKRASHLFFLFDEPSTGLHHADVHRLLGLFDVLNRAGHTVAVADHRLQIVARAHHLIDLGPGGGKEGGRVVFHGSPREMVARGTGKTADALREWVRPAPGDTGGSSGPGAPRDGERP